MTLFWQIYRFETTMSPSKNDSGRPISPSDGGPEPAEVPLPLNTELVIPINGVVVPKEEQYLVVSWDLDTTGRRLIDEICQIGG